MSTAPPSSIGSMNRFPLMVLGWMIVSMSVTGAGIALGWSWWMIGMLCCACLGLAYVTIRKLWDQHREERTHIYTSLTQLQRLVGIQPMNLSLVSEHEPVGRLLQCTVGQVEAHLRNLETERTKMVAILENLVEGVLAFDSKGCVLFSNPSARNMLELDGQQLQGKSVWEVIRNKDLADLVERSRDLALHQTRSAELEIYPLAPMTIQVYGLPFPLANDQKGSVVVLHDVTQLRRLEHVRTEFIENVSHELRTPLTAIVGYLETLIDEPSLETPNNRKFVHVAHQHAERLNRLVEDLRSLSEIESGKIALRSDIVTLKDVVEEVSAMFQPQLHKKGLHLTNQIDEEACIWADRDRVIQILVNLVDNAVKYTSEGGHVSFDAKQVNGTLALRVMDTGQGIPSTDLPRVTQRFYRVDRARSREEGGTGLGLSIVKHLVQLLNGQLRIHSELGKGTTVEVALPCPDD